jgi:hypothetical protein
MSEMKKVVTSALRDLTTKGWADSCMVPKSVVLLIADELDLLRAKSVTLEKLQRDYDALKRLCSRSEVAAAEAQVQKRIRQND